MTAGAGASLLMQHIGGCTKNHCASHTLPPSKLNRASKLCQGETNIGIMLVVAEACSLELHAPHSPLCVAQDCKLLMINLWCSLACEKHMSQRLQERSMAIDVVTMSFQPQRGTTGGGDFAR